MPFVKENIARAHPRMVIIPPPKFSGYTSYGALVENVLVLEREYFGKIK